MSPPSAFLAAVHAMRHARSFASDPLTTGYMTLSGVGIVEVKRSANVTNPSWRYLELVFNVKSC